MSWILVCLITLTVFLSFLAYINIMANARKASAPLYLSLMHGF